MVDGIESIVEKIYNWLVLFICKKKKFVMINIFKVKECFYKDLKRF